MVGKLIFVYLWMFMTAVFCKVLTFGTKETDTVTGLRYVLMRINQYFLARIIIYTIGGMWISYERPECDYSKYLGPDWKADYDRTKVASVVINHTAAADSMIVSMEQLVTCVAKKGVRDTPGIGWIA